MTDPLDVSKRTYLDNESRAIIYHGASVNQLAEIFNTRVPDVMRRLAGLDPVGVGRQGNPIYKISDAASKLIKIPITEQMITDHLRRMNPKELPPLLSKLFWDAMKVRAQYREQAGELWLSTDVLSAASEAFQSLRMSLLLIPDMLRDETEITETQVLLVQKVIDEALEVARERLVSNFGKPNGLRPGPDAEDQPL